MRPTAVSYVEICENHRVREITHIELDHFYFLWYVKMWNFDAQGNLVSFPAFSLIYDVFFWYGALMCSASTIFMIPSKEVP